MRKPGFSPNFQYVAGCRLFASKKDNGPTKTYYVIIYLFFLSFDSLCLPPRLQPPPIVDGGDLPEVTVLVGTKLRYQIGYVRYNGGEEEFISSEVIGAISAITAILVSIGIVVLIVLKHKSTQVINLIIWL